MTRGRAGSGSVDQLPSGRWRVRNASGGHVCDVSSLAQARRYLRTYPWAKGCKIYRVTWSRREAGCYWPPSGAVKSATPTPPKAPGEE